MSFNLHSFGTDLPFSHLLTVEKETPETVGCLNNKIEWKRKNVDYNQFAVIVPGDKFLCSTEDSEYVEASV